MIVLRKTHQKALDEIKTQEALVREFTELWRQESIAKETAYGNLAAAKTRVIGLEEQIARADVQIEDQRKEIAELRLELREARLADKPKIDSLKTLSKVLQPDLTDEEIAEQKAKREEALAWHKGLLGRMDQAWGNGMSFEEAAAQPGFTMLQEFAGDDEE